jgi:hypothetical protein
MQSCMEPAAARSGIAGASADRTSCLRLSMGSWYRSVTGAVCFKRTCASASFETWRPRKDLTKSLVLALLLQVGVSARTYIGSTVLAERWT